MNINKLPELYKDKEFVFKMINYEIDLNRLKDDEVFLNTMNWINNLKPSELYEGLSKLSMNEKLSDILHNTKLNIFLDDISLFKEYIASNIDSDMCLLVFKEKEELWQDEELVFNSIRSFNEYFYMEEAMFLKYLQIDEERLITSYPIKLLVGTLYPKESLYPEYLNDIKYLKLFIKYGVIYSFEQIQNLIYNVDLDDFDEILGYNTSSINYMKLDTYDKVMCAVKKYNLTTCLRHAPKDFIDLNIVKEALKRGMDINHYTKYVVCNYEVTEYLIKRGYLNALNFYLDNISALEYNQENNTECDDVKIGKLVLLVCNSLKNNSVDYLFHEYILSRYNLVKIIVENYNPNIIDKFVEKFRINYLDKQIDLELFELALKNGYNADGESPQFFWQYEFVNRALDYGVTGLFENLINFSLDNIINDKLILKSNYCGYYTIYTRRINELKNEIIDTINGNRELSEKLKEISDDPYELALIAGINLDKLNMGDNIYNYKYIKILVQKQHNIDYIDEFAIRCEKGLVESKLLDEELFSLALIRGYFLTPSSPDYIKTNYKFVNLSIKRGQLEGFVYYLAKGYEVTDEMVYNAIDNGYKITKNTNSKLSTNRKYIMHALKRGYPNALDIYYSKTKNIDDELIRTAIDNGYSINDNTPKEIMSNIEYIKLIIKYYGYLLNKHTVINNTISEYAKYVKEHPDDNLASVTELYDVFIDSIPNNEGYIKEPSVVPSYEDCEYLLKNGCLSALSRYERYLEINPSSKNIDTHLRLLYLLNSNKFITKFDILNQEENDKWLAISFMINSLKKEHIFTNDNIDEYFDDFGYTDKLSILLKKNKYSKYKKMLNNLIHNDNIIQSGITDSMFNIFIPYMTEYIGISYDKISLIKELGKDVLLYLDREEVIRFISLEESDINKITELYKCDKFSLNEFNDKIYDALKQEQFTHDYPIYKDIFVRFRNSIRLKDINELERLKYLVNTILPDVSYEEIDSYIEQGKNNNLDALHNLCDIFIRKAREIYRYESNNLTNDIKLPYEYDENDALKKIALYLLENINWFVAADTDISLEEYEVLKRVILDKNITHEEKQKYGEQLRKLYKALYKYIEDYKDHINIQEIDRLKHIKRVYYIEEKDSISIFPQISKMNIDRLLNIINNDALYNNLNKYLKYYKIAMLPDSINKFLKDKLDINENCNYSDISRYIMNYPIFLDSEVRKQNSFSETLVDYNNVKINFINLLKNYISINTEIPEIRRLLSKEDYSLIDKDPSPNNTLENKEVRLGRAVELIPLLYNNSSITIPSFDENININGKEINVIVGNRSNTCNLTHGERTGSCMRISGAGESLFDFCIKNSNGFHIRFEEPNTHEYISRVSGFRNGNSVFLNQLRYSSNKDLYTNDELVEYIKVVAYKLIDLTRDSSFPIENVFISDGYVMENSETINIGNVNLKSGLPYFYTDINSFSIVSLAHTSTPYTPLNFYDIIGEYKPVRDKVYGIEVGIDKLKDLVNSRYAIKVLLNNEDYTIISDIVEDNLLDAYVGTDFYVYIDSDYNIHYDYFDMDNYHDKEASLEEMNKYKEILMNKYNITEKRY